MKRYILLILLIVGGVGFYISNLEKHFPLETSLPGSDAPIYITRQSDNFVLFQKKDDMWLNGSTKYFLASKDDLTPSTLAQLLTYPINLSRVVFPCAVILKDDSGTSREVILTGKSNELVYFYESNPDHEESLPIDGLPAKSAQLLQLFKVTERQSNFPLNLTLKSHTGKLIDAEITGRSKNLIKYTIKSRGLKHGKYPTYYSNISDFTNSAELYALPTNFTKASLPCYLSLSMKSGKTREVYATAKSYEEITFESERHANQHTINIEELAIESQKLLSNFTVTTKNRTKKYPYETVLTNASGKSITVNLQGRSKTEVQFTKGDGKKLSHVKIAHLSEASSELIEQFPILPMDSWAWNNVQEVASYKSKIEDLERLQKAFPEGHTKYNGYTKKIDTINLKIEHIEAKIKDHRESL